MPVAELSGADRALLAAPGTRKAGVTGGAAANFTSPWPQQAIALDGPVDCKVISEDREKQRYIYECPGYRFTCDAAVTYDALQSFSVMFEATRKFAKSMPLGMGGRERNGKLEILLFRSMQGYLAAGGMPGSAGCFTRGVVLVPMESLGLKEGRTGFGLDRTRDSRVLIHELTHQLTPAAYMQPGTSGWFCEGLAEYAATTSYSWGTFRPDTRGNAVKAYVTGAGENGKGGRGLGKEIRVPRLREFMLMPYSSYSGANANRNYGMGLLLTHYFLHMENGGQARRIRQFLMGLQAGATGEAALAPLLGGGGFEKLEGEIAAAWSRMGVEIRFGGGGI